MLKGKTVVLGVTGSIAAYKMANVASMLVKMHAEVHSSSMWHIFPSRKRRMCFWLRLLPQM